MDQLSSLGRAVTLVHFTYAPAEGDWRVACMPNMTEFHQTEYHPNYQRANDPRAVTCPACKRETVFQKALETLEIALRSPVRG